MEEPAAPETSTDQARVKFTMSRFWRSGWVHAYAGAVLCLVIGTLIGTVVSFRADIRSTPDYVNLLLAANLVALTIGLLGFGIALWRSDREVAGSRGNLGAALISGVILAIVFTGGQFVAEVQQERQADRKNLQVTLSLTRDLTGIDMQERNLSGLYLYRKVLIDANLLGVDLRGATLDRSDLRGVILYDADLYAARFWSADLRCADLREARIFPVDDLDDRVKQIFYNNFRGAVIDRQTRWPDDFDPSRIPEARREPPAGTDKGPGDDDPCADDGVGSGRSCPIHLR